MTLTQTTAGPGRKGTLDLRQVAESAAEFLEEAPATEIIRWAAATFGDRLCLTSSMSDALLIDLVSPVKPGIDVLFVDTGYHFAETIGTRSRARPARGRSTCGRSPSRPPSAWRRRRPPRASGGRPRPSGIASASPPR